jgi:hypothetical protein
MISASKLHTSQFPNLSPGVLTTSKKIIHTSSLYSTNFPNFLSEKTFWAQQTTTRDNNPLYFFHNFCIQQVDGEVELRESILELQTTP